MKTMMHIWMFLIFVSFIFILSPVTNGFAEENNKHFSNEIAEAGLQAILDGVLSQPDIVNTVMLVDAPKYGFSWSNAGGFANPETGETMTTEHQFRIASVQKMITSVVVLQLIEEHHFTLETKLGELLTAADLMPGYDVADLHVYADKPYGTEITVKQLLNHTSGMRDYVFDDATATDFAPNSLAFAFLADAIGLDPTGISRRQWSAADILAYYLENGLAANALSPPGEQYHYSDTNYLLLGIVIEKITGTDLATQYRQRIFTPLGMTRSYLEWYEPAWGEGPVHHFMNLEPLDIQLNLDVVELKLNTSFDWAGGGIVSTVGDLNKFMCALFEGRLFQKKRTLISMLKRFKLDHQEWYGLGIEVFRDHQTLFMGHSGLWGTLIAYLPREQATIVFSVNQWPLSFDTRAILPGIVQALDTAK